MKINKEKKLIFCANCNKYIDGYIDIYLIDGFENESRINCLVCDTTVGYTWDKEWKQIFG